ncbi:class I SAM-dependent methyltransferase [Kitasatospora sp. NPDC002227]|uniref:class I SAM-dependent methyltransferase n=1 Tax=Kitasatospora sp. NPDC002227 TaxID=3154773 RepID=UPI00331D6345
MTSQPAIDPALLAYYDLGREQSRLHHGHDRLEYWRTQDVLRRLLGPAPLRVLDVGGGAGAHAEWLAADGHRVDLLDPVPLHVAQAAELPGVTARLGDARALDVPDAAYDAVLLLGPLYHLPDRADRIRALAEARRAVRPGGLVVAATINRYASLHDHLRRGGYFDPRTRGQIDATTESGLLGAAPSGFTTAYFHRPAEVPGEFHDAGLTTTGQYGLEGAAWLLGSVNDHLDDPGRRRIVLDALRRTEAEPSLLGVSGHLLTAART